MVVNSVPPAQLQLLQQKFAAGALVLHGLLRHENRISVMNFCLKRAGAAGDVVRSKEPLMFLIGSRCKNGISMNIIIVAMIMFS
jgi:hypothetical protein